MTSRLHRRITRAQESVDAIATGPEEIRAARRHWQRTGELPTHPKLWAAVVRINEAIVEASARMNVFEPLRAESKETS